MDTLTMRPRPQASARPSPVRQYAPPTLADVEAALAFVSPDDRETWLRMAFAIRAEFGDDGEALAVWDTWSRGSARYNERDARDVWRSARPRSIGIGTLFHEARAHGYRPTGTRPAASSRPRPQVAPAEPLKRWDDALQHAWDDCLPLRGSVGERYLLARRCAFPPDDGDVRFHPAAWHPFGKVKLPALVARVTDATTGRPMTLHTTFVQEDGTGKADVDPPRMLRGGYAKAGGVIRLWPDDAIETRLTIAEGIETALTVAHARPPAWSCIDAGNLGALPVLAGITSLLIAADNDPAGRKAAHECGRRWHEAGCEVHIYTPTAGDINDEVQHG